MPFLSKLFHSISPTTTRVHVTHLVRVIKGVVHESRNKRCLAN